LTNHHKSSACIILIVLMASLTSGYSVFQGDPEVETLIKSVKHLEEHPLDKDAKEMRRNAMTWVIQTDKVSVILCSLLLSGVDKKYKYGDVFGQYTLAMAAFKLANPDKANDDNAAQQAGIDSALIAYESMVKQEPKARNAFLDGLISKRTDGSLAQYVVENNCRKQ
jgi:hypothetical protein